MNVLQSGCPFKLHLIKTIEGDYKQENLIHKKFNKYRYRGEWFVPSKEILLFIENPHILKDSTEIINQTREFYKKPKKKTTSINFRVDQFELLIKTKKETGISVAKIIEQILDIYFENELKLKK